MYGQFPCPVAYSSYFHFEFDAKKPRGSIFSACLQLDYTLNTIQRSVLSLICSPLIWDRSLPHNVEFEQFIKPRCTAKSFKVLGKADSIVRIHKKLTTL